MGAFQSFKTLKRSFLFLNLNTVTEVPKIQLRLRIKQNPQNSARIHDIGPIN